MVIEHEETQDEIDNGIRWIFVEGAEYNLEAHEILEWLGKYGTFETNLTEKLHSDCNPVYDPIFTGDYYYIMPP